MDALLNVFLVELLDQRCLDGSTTRSQLGRVNSAGRGRGGEDLGLLGEHVAGQLSNLGCVRGTTREDDLVDIQNIQLRLLDNLLDQASELSKDLAREQLVTGPVDS